MQATELAIAAPQVVAHRLSRMATAGFNPSAADRREFVEMGSEKVLAFSQGWMAMAAQMLRWQSGLVQAMWGMWLKPGSSAPMAALWQQSSLAPWKALGAGLAPVHAKAVSNARRLNRR